MKFKPLKFKPFANPLLIVGDNPALPGGLSRICRDLATLACTMPEFRVGVLGRGAGNRVDFPFTLYSYPEHDGGWGEEYIQPVWEDFSRGENGIILTTDDPSRRHWFANPTGMPEQLQRFLGPGRNFQKWGYFPIDSVGPSGVSLPLALTDCVQRYDRVLAASDWGAEVIQASGCQADWLPHGLLDRFVRIPSAKALCEWQDKIVVGCVMANQSRKDYPVAFRCFQLLKAEYGNKLQIWFHTDQMIRYWNVFALCADYGVGDCIEVTTSLSDEQLALRYSACDCTILPSAGEGFGYTIAESLACGTSCVVTDYAAGPALVPEGCRVPVSIYRADTVHNVMRAVIQGVDFAKLVLGEVTIKQSDPDYWSEKVAETVEHLRWDKLKHEWIKWFRRGLV